MDLDRHMKSEPVAARPPSVAYKMEKAWCRNRIAYTTSVFVGLALILGLAVSLRQTGLATRAEAVASLERDRARDAEAVSEAAKIEAVRFAEDARRNLYAANVHSAHSHLEKGNFGAAKRLLEFVRPVSGTDGDTRVGWEWRYCVDQLKGDDAIILHQHSVGIGTLALSPDERFLLAGDWNGDVVVWNLESKPPKPQKRFNVSREHPVFGLELCPKGKYLAAYELSVQGRLSLYEFDPIRGDVILLERLEVYGAGFSPSGDRLAVNLRDKGLSFYDLEERRWLQEADLPNLSQLRAITPKDIFRRLTYSEDGSRLALCGLQNWIGVLNLGNGELIENRSPSESISFGGDSTGGVSNNPVFLPGGDEIITTSHNDPVRRWRLTGKTVELVSSHGGRDLFFPVVDSSRSRIIFPGVDHAVHIWDAETFQETSRLYGHGDEVFDIAMRSDGRIYSADLKGQIRLWSSSRNRRGVTIPVNSISVWPTFSPDGSEIAVGLDSQKTAVFDAATGLRRDLFTKGIPTKYSEDGKTLFLSEPMRRETGEETRADRYTGRVISVASEHGTKLADPVGSVLGECNPVLDFGGGIGCTFDWNVRERIGIDLQTGEELFRLPTREAWVFSGLSVSPDRRVAILSSSLWQSEGSSIPLEVWDIESYPGRKVTEIEDPFSRMMTGSRFSPNGALLAVFDRNGTVKLFDTSTWELRENLVMDGHHRSVFSVGFSPDGKTLASTGDDGLINLWNVDVGALMVTLSVEGSAQSVVFSPDGKTLAVTVGPRPFVVDRIVLYHAPTMEEIELDELLRKHGRR